MFSGREDQCEDHIHAAAFHALLDQLADVIDMLFIALILCNCKDQFIIVARFVEPFQGVKGDVAIAGAVHERGQLAHVMDGAGDAQLALFAAG